MQLEYANDSLPPASDLLKEAEALEREEDKERDKQRIASVIKELEVLERSGLPKNTIDNYKNIFLYDGHFKDVRKNDLSGYPEIREKGRWRLWEDADDSAALAYIERNYGLSTKQKCEDGFKIFMEARTENPAQQEIEKTEWDGVSRVEQFLIEWMGVKDEPYSREVSRLIFAGGINRLYRPGSKFDCVPVLIGGQGSGKSTICRWLALEDSLYNSVKTFSVTTKQGYESIKGFWICEIEELVAIIGDTEGKSERVKAFLSEQTDNYRMPFGKRVTANPRSCIFIGTTNMTEFLQDKTGNRRWFPIWCYGDSDRLYEEETSCKAYIRQAWAEMLHYYHEQSPIARPVPKRELADVILEKQSQAEEEDYRESLIRDYLHGRERVCCLQIWQEALHSPGKDPSHPTKSEMREIGQILRKLGCTPEGNKALPGYGCPKSFRVPEILASAERGGKHIAYKV